MLHAAAGGFDQPPFSDWDGVLFEHHLFHEIRSYMHYAGTKGSLGYWATPRGNEVDFIGWYGGRMVAVEAESGRRYRRAWRVGIESLLAGGVEARPTSSAAATRSSTWRACVLPAETFLCRMHAADVIGA